MFASDPRWAAMVPLRSDLIGASMWYEAIISRDGGFAVNITAGSGDCMAGCINQHTWHYTSMPRGPSTLEARTARRSSSQRRHHPTSRLPSRFCSTPARCARSSRSHPTRIARHAPSRTPRSRSTTPDGNGSRHRHHGSRRHRCVRGAGRCLLRRGRSTSRVNGNARGPGLQHGSAGTPSASSIGYDTGIR